MASFCRSCSIYNFGEDFGDLANITTVEDESKGLYCWVLCEDCGFIQVDHIGRCLTDCAKRHRLTYKKGEI
jgi:hypothetical protein